MRSENIEWCAGNGHATKCSLPPREALLFVDRDLVS